MFARATPSYIEPKERKSWVYADVLDFHTCHNAYGMHIVHSGMGFLHVMGNAYIPRHLGMGNRTGIVGAETDRTRGGGRKKQQIAPETECTRGGYVARGGKP